MQTVIEVTKVSKSTKDQVILNDISFQISKGKICGFVGRNGSGKSVLLKVICGLMLPTEGEIKIRGEAIKKGGFAKEVGVLLDCTGFLNNQSGFDNLQGIASINNRITAEDIKRYMELVGLDSNSKKKVEKYSLGMKQRLGIAQALMEQPDILLLDEPMNGLDESGVEEMREVFKELAKTSNTTILLTSHNKEDIELLCDHVWKLEKGKMMQER